MEENMNTASTDTKLQTVSRITRDISDGILLLDKHGTILYINTNAEKLLGSSLDESQ